MEGGLGVELWADSGRCKSWWVIGVELSNKVRVQRKGVSRGGRGAIQVNQRRGRRECGAHEAACFRGIGWHVQARVADSKLV